MHTFEAYGSMNCTSLLSGLPGSPPTCLSSILHRAVSSCSFQVYGTMSLPWPKPASTSPLL